MTKEEQEQWIKKSIETFIFAYTGERIRISNDDAQYFRARAMSRLNLPAPSLPSNLDEAAQEYAKLRKSAYETVFYAFKAGAEWMEGQGDTLEIEVKEDAGGYPYIPCIELYDYDKDEPLFKAGDKVVVQIRKK